MGYDLTGNTVSSTYGYLVQYRDGSFYDGSGNFLNVGESIHNNLSGLFGLPDYYHLDTSTYTWITSASSGFVSRGGDIMSGNLTINASLGINGKTYINSPSEAGFPSALTLYWPSTHTGSSATLEFDAIYTNRPRIGPPTGSGVLVLLKDRVNQQLHFGDSNVTLSFGAQGYDFIPSGYVGAFSYQNSNGTLFTCTSVGKFIIGTETDIPAKFKVSGNAIINGSLNLSNYNIVNVATPVNSSDAVNKWYVDSSFATYLPTINASDYLITKYDTDVQLAGNVTMQGRLNMGFGIIINRNSSTALPSGIYNVLIGDRAGNALTTASRNTIVGDLAGVTNITGTDNTFLGYNAGNQVRSTGNTAIGSAAGGSGALQNTNYTTAVGYYALPVIRNVGNTGVGAAVGQFMQQSQYGTFLGYSSFYTQTTYTGANYNVGLGAFTGYKNLEGSANTYIGSFAGYNSSIGYGNVFIGFGAGANEITSNKLYIANSSTATPLIYGQFDTSILVFYGNVGVGETNPTYTLDVSGTVNIDSSLVIGPTKTFSEPFVLTGAPSGATFMRIKNTGASGKTMTLGVGTAGTEWVTDGYLSFQSTGSYVRFVDSTTTGMTLSGGALSINGSLGVAKTASSYALDVSGNIKANNFKQVMQLKVIDDTTILSTGESQLIFCIPYEYNNMYLSNAQAYVTTYSSSTNKISILLRNMNSSTYMLSTPITIDQSAYTSYTASVPSVINTSNDDVSTGHLISIDVSAAGSGAKGLGVILTFSLP